MRPWLQMKGRVRIFERLYRSGSLIGQCLSLTQESMVHFLTPARAHLLMQDMFNGFKIRGYPTAL